MANIPPNMSENSIIAANVRTKHSIEQVYTEDTSHHLDEHIMCLSHEQLHKNALSRRQAMIVLSTEYISKIADVSMSLTRRSCQDDRFDSPYIDMAIEILNTTESLKVYDKLGFEKLNSFRTK